MDVRKAGGLVITWSLLKNSFAANKMYKILLFVQKHGEHTLHSSCDHYWTNQKQAFSMATDNHSCHVGESCLRTIDLVS